MRYINWTGKKLEKDILAIKKGLCDEKQENICKIENGTNIQWACRNCDKKKAKDIKEYTWRMLEIRLLQKGGYKFHNNDLSLEQWLDLGRIEQWLETQQHYKLN